MLILSLICVRHINYCYTSVSVCVCVCVCVCACTYACVCMCAFTCVHDTCFHVIPYLPHVDTVVVFNTPANIQSPGSNNLSLMLTRKLQVIFPSVCCTQYIRIVLHIRTYIILSSMYVCITYSILGVTKVHALYKEFCTTLASWHVSDRLVHQLFITCLLMYVQMESFILLCKLPENC